MRYHSIEELLIIARESDKIKLAFGGQIIDARRYVTVSGISDIKLLALPDEPTAADKATVIRSATEFTPNLIIIPMGTDEELMSLLDHVEGEKVYKFIR